MNLPNLCTATLISLLLASCFSAPAYQGPLSDHFDGHRFRNDAPFEQRSFCDLLRWQLSGGEVEWPDWVKNPQSEPPPATVLRGARVTIVNHATVLIQLPGLNLLTDPVWSDRVGPLPGVGPRRHRPPGVAWEKLPKIDVVLISHNHYDHLDLPTLQRLYRRDAPLVVAGLGTRALLRNSGIERAIELDWWEAHSLPGATITFLPAQHWSTRGLSDRNHNLWGSFYVSGGGLRIYFGGDTAVGPHFAEIRQRYGAPDLALLPIGAYLPRWFMRPQHIDPSEAVEAHELLGAARSVAIHWGTFDQSDEGLYQPAGELGLALARRGLSPSAFLALENGQSLTVPPPLLRK